MTKIQLGTGSSSASTHRITRASSTLNRQQVGRPSNLAIEEAARSADTTSTTTNDRPSRLVNLRVHAADFAQLPPEEETPTTNAAFVPKMVELGMSNPSDAEMMADFSQIVPPEETTVDQSVPYLPAVSTANLNVTTTTVAPMPAAAEIDTDALAMNIAADYAAASLGASLQTPSATATDVPINTTMAGFGMVEVTGNSVDAIAHAASEAIASIRAATDPEEVAEQVTSLKSFAENIKASSAAPEMVELSNTIEKFVEIAMKSTRVQEEVEKKAAIHQAKAATVKAAAQKATPKITPKAARPVVTKKPVASTSARRTVRPTPSATHPISKRTPKKTAPKLIETEDQALRKALRSVAAMDGEQEEKPGKKRAPIRRKSSAKHFVLAFFCAAACVAAVVYFVASNIPDISVKVAAMQTGIEASYPSYIPRDYTLSDINSEEGKIVLTFKGPDKAAFSLSEEKSSWDSTTLLRNFVEPTWEDNYITTHEQGITIYISGANAAWVNGGVMYKIESNTTNTLTKKQLRNIVTSL